MFSMILSVLPACAARPRHATKYLHHATSHIYKTCLNQRVGQRYLETAAKQEKQKQKQAPWHRDIADEPPVNKLDKPQQVTVTKGKLLTTPSRLLKLVLPLHTIIHESGERKDIEPLALLVHPQQPLSYLERLIQSELPFVEDEKGRERIPSVEFRAVDNAQDSIMPKVKVDDNEDPKPPKGKGASSRPGVESYSGLGREHKHGDDKSSFVRWSLSTDIGDFVRDAARGREFIVRIEGQDDIMVEVPSFRDRTYYLRLRLRKTARRLKHLAALKTECDDLAHRGARRVALGGFGILVAWWLIVFRMTFMTDLGWDTMEPVTYLVSLSTAMGGYLWFLYHNREMSYRQALNITVTTRQTRLYEAKGFDIDLWQSLLEEGAALRKEIKKVADDYDVEWDESHDEQDEAVTKALDEVDAESKSEKRRKKDSEKDED